MRELACYAAAVGLIFGLWVLAGLASTQKGRFWRMVARHPDSAVLLLSHREDCLIDPTVRPPRAYSGPYRIRTTEGAVRRVYVLRSQLAAMREDVSAELAAREATATMAADVYRKYFGRTS